MDRLTNKINGDALLAKENIEVMEISSGAIGIIETLIKRLAWYEELEEQGKLFIIPVKVGGTVYDISNGAIVPNMVDNYYFSKECDGEIMIEYCTGYSKSVDSTLQIGKNLFTNKQDAKKAIAEEKMKGDKSI